MKQDWHVTYSIQGRTTFYCDTKEEAEMLANGYLSQVCRGLYPDCCCNDYEIEEIYTYDDESVEE